MKIQPSIKYINISIFRKLNRHFIVCKRNTTYYIYNTSRTNDKGNLSDKLCTCSEGVTEAHSLSVWKKHMQIIHLSVLYGKR